ncbi:MAG: hypothetical protein AAF736_15355 [Pseudomonadota bacterium]
MSQFSPRPLGVAMALALFVLLSGCKSVPLDSSLNGYDLVASPGVMAYFSDPSVTALEVGKNVVCRRHRRVGTHLMTKVCMTQEEYQDRTRHTQETHHDRMSPGCTPVASNSSYMNSELGGALLVSSCGDSINRGP